MDVVGKLATSLGRRDEKPNQELAREIVSNYNSSAVKRLVELLTSKNKALRSDSIKTLYEIGEQKPELIAPYTEQFLALLESKDNRIQWGAMCALDTIAPVRPKVIHSALDKIMEAAKRGTVITRDHAIGVLINLGNVKAYTDEMMALIIDELRTAPVNQLPTYSEKSMHLVNDRNRSLFVKVLSFRLEDLDQESKRKRLEKVIRKVVA